MLEGSSMLLDILGVVIAFSVVMLLLSLLVTSLGQATQAILRLRARNLQRGLAAILAHELPDRKDKTRGYAATLLNSPEIALLNRRKDPNSLVNRIRGPVTSWLETETLRDALLHGQKGGGQKKARSAEPMEFLKGIDIEATVKRFERVHAPMRKRFGVAVRAIALVWALIVAASFQISTPELVRQLSTDPELRAHYAGIATDTLEFGRRTLDQRLSYEDVYKEALERLAEKHPELRPLIDKTSTAGTQPESLAEDLAERLENNSERVTIVAEFEDLLTRGLERQRDESLASARATLDQLSLINITPWRYGTEFYLRDGAVQLRNIFGVLLSAILLTLGAPFWFNTLKTAVAFRDLLAPKRDNNKQDNKQDDKKPAKATTRKVASRRKKRAKKP